MLFAFETITYDMNIIEIDSVAVEARTDKKHSF